MKTSQTRVLRNLALLFILMTSSFISVETKSKEAPKVEGPVIGIDLGTTYSCVGIFKNGRVEIIPNELGNRITPSFVAFTDEERLVGEAAKNQAALNPERSIYVIKRLIGRNFKDKEVQKDKKLVSYNIVDKNGKPYVSANVIGGELKVMSPEEISAMILVKMKQIAENYLGQEVKNAVRVEFKIINKNAEYHNINLLNYNYIIYNKDFY